MHLFKETSKVNLIYSIVFGIGLFFFFFQNFIFGVNFGDIDANVLSTLHFDAQENKKKLANQVLHNDYIDNKIHFHNNFIKKRVSHLVVE